MVAAKDDFVLKDLIFQFLHIILYCRFLFVIFKKFCNVSHPSLKYIIFFFMSSLVDFMHCVNEPPLFVLLSFLFFYA